MNPVESSILDINRKRYEKKTELTKRCNNGRFPRYINSQLKIFVPAGKDFKIIIPIELILISISFLYYIYIMPLNKISKKRNR